MYDTSSCFLRSVICPPVGRADDQPDHSRPSKMSNLTVSFEPGRKASTSSTGSGSGSKPIPHTPKGNSEPSKSIPYPIDTGLEPYRKKTFHLPRGSPCSPSHSRPGSPQIPQSQDPERQPLLSATETNWRRTAYPIVLGMMAVVILGFLVGIGGYRLSHGEGEHRWPGGPQ